jgi:hypothetical protein
MKLRLTYHYSSILFISTFICNLFNWPPKYLSLNVPILHHYHHSHLWLRHLHQSSLHQVAHLAIKYVQFSSHLWFYFLLQYSSCLFYF